MMVMKEMVAGILSVTNESVIIGMVTCHSGTLHSICRRQAVLLNHPTKNLLRKHLNLPILILRRILDLGRFLHKSRKNPVSFIWVVLALAKLSVRYFYDTMLCKCYPKVPMTYRQRYRGLNCCPKKQKKYAMQW